MIEQERKFKLKFLPEKLESVEIKQGYLVSDGDRVLRVRIIDDKTALMTFKISKSDTIRNEYEYKILIEDGLELYKNSLYRITKRRYYTTFNGNHVDIDVYKNGKSVIEIEFENELTDLPPYCGEEVTGVKEWSNIWMAMHNNEN